MPPRYILVVEGTCEHVASYEPKGIDEPYYEAVGYFVSNYGIAGRMILLVVLEGRY